MLLADRQWCISGHDITRASTFAKRSMHSCKQQLRTDECNPGACRQALQQEVSAPGTHLNGRVEGSQPQALPSPGIPNLCCPLAPGALPDAPVHRLGLLGLGSGLLLVRNGYRHGFRRPGRLGGRRADRAARGRHRHKAGGALGAGTAARQGHGMLFQHGYHPCRAGNAQHGSHDAGSCSWQGLAGSSCARPAHHTNDCWLVSGVAPSKSKSLPVHTAYQRSRVPVWRALKTPRS